MSEPSDALVLFEQTDAIARITLNRPDKLNAINHELGLQLWEAFARCHEHASIRAIVLAGAGRAFVRGDELGRERTPDEEESLRRRGRINHYVAARALDEHRALDAQPATADRRADPGLRVRRRLQPGVGRRLPRDGARRQTRHPVYQTRLATGTNLLQQYVGIGKAIEMTLLG